MKKLYVAALAVALLPLTFPRSAAAEGAPAAAPVPSWLATVPSADLFTPKPMERTCFRCLINGHSTPSYIGTGSDCTAALGALRNQALDFADNDCTNRGAVGSCNFVVSSGTCTQVSPGHFQQSGYATYGCSFYIC